MKVHPGFRLLWIEPNWIVGAIRKPVTSLSLLVRQGHGKAYFFGYQNELGDSSMSCSIGH